ncbi:tyrosine-type recombinase/integrase [Marinobacterium arenosum]|uniref:tyrosine-type recombinase/integrase n=1 Tax=Marinobacterium arenosum TaxID=2862496 RepID=UPI001C98D699|nr:tyrosine-type recombinase/integrase [Marinobacterium arenosum]MBY4676495.1 tyrosine-type recombinase/integrase [Marinobacterium arenosum]
MPHLIHRFGPIAVTVRYLWQKHSDGPYYYRRRVPKDIAPKLGKTFNVIALRTRDKLLAAKRIAKLTRQDDELWYRMRNGLATNSAREAAQALLESFDLEARAANEQQDREIHVDVFLESLERKVPGNEHPADHLDDHELRALAIIQGKEEFSLSDAKQVYLKKRDGLETRADNRKLRNATDSSFDLVIGAIGDRSLKQYRRKDVSEVIHGALVAGLKTTTIKRRLGVVRAAVNELIKEYELDGLRNPFADFEIPKLGQDSDERASLNAEQVQKLRAYVASNNTDSANIIGMLLDTGARIAEVVGLWRDDVVLDAEVPHVVFHENPMRRLKTKASKRKIPLVGDALKAAQRALEKPGEDALFSRYMTQTKVKNDAASAAVNKVLKRLDCQTAHCMRHTMRTRLRNADVPEPRAKEIQGWSRESVADQYGEQTALRNLRADLLKTL